MVKINNRVKFLQVEFDNLTFDQTVCLVEKNINDKKSTHLLGMNADKINELDKEDSNYKRIVLNADIINPDGFSVVLASKFLCKPLPERIAGIDLMQCLIEISALKGYSLYFLGAKETIVNKMVNNIKNRYPSINICGFRNGYFSKNEKYSIVKELMSKKPDIVFVGITSPEKEYLIDFFLNQGINSIFMGVGGSFDVLSGEIKRAPIWMQRMGLEWLFRVIQEPRRLFKRYFFGNSIFVYKVLKEKVSYLFERNTHENK
ncbi:WecB/TagA/CpsF family glycosyltransferase [Enterococcus faecalis]|nr:WecB/TagA/CpsF family glycosyltransferase [Enterococcus faecalis]EHB6499347.1 WecB/TagA/CpsF family glycosyltransferase [Enterococcus faecalis]